MQECRSDIADAARGWKPIGVELQVYFRDPFFNSVTCDFDDLVN